MWITSERAVNLAPIAKLYLKIEATQETLSSHQLISCLVVLAEFRVIILFKDLITRFTRIRKNKIESRRP
jgi:hypothetical protein